MTKVDQIESTDQPSQKSHSQVNPESASNQLQLRAVSNNVQENQDLVPFERVARERLDAVMREALANLSPEASACLELPELQRQLQVFNSAMVYTKIFDHLIVSRYEHQVHAAAQVATLRQLKNNDPSQIQMSDYELAVLELALLFHDFGHVPCSHAMDQVFAAMRSSPDLRALGYHSHDYHELHGAQEFGRGSASVKVRSILGNPLFDDVMAILTLYDRRGVEEKCAEYGEFQPSLKPERLLVIHKIFDRLDRSSFVALDHCCAGYTEPIYQRAQETTRRFLETIHVLYVEGKGVVCNDDDRLGAEDPHAALILARRDHFFQVPAHPTNGLVSNYLQTSLWKRFEEMGIRNGDDEATDLYEQVRRSAFEDPQEFLGEVVWKQLTDRTCCITDSIAPVVTLDKNILSKRGQEAIKLGEPTAAGKGQPVMLQQDVCGTPMFDVTAFELHIRERLRQEGIDIPVYILVAPLLDKEFKYDIKTQNGVVRKEYQPVNCDPTRPSDHSGYVMVAAEALDEFGVARDLSKLREVVESEINVWGWVKDGVLIRDTYNPLAFVRPLNENVFCESVRRKMEDLHPQWIRKGGSGLLSD